MNSSNNQLPDTLATKISSEDALRKRRAFMKGSAAMVPVVMTLRSGSAFAAESISCLMKLRTTPPTEKPAIFTTSENSDTWRRVTSSCGKAVNIVESSPGVFKDGESFEVYQVPSSPSGLTNVGKWFRKSDNNADSANIVKEESNVLRIDVSTPPLDACYVLVQVDDTGIPTGLIGPSTDFPYVTTSCYSSLHP